MKVSGSVICCGVSLGCLIIGILMGCFFAALAYKPLTKSVYSNVVFYKTQYESCEGAISGFEVAIQGHTQDMIAFRKESTLINVLDRRGAFILMMKDLGVYNQAIYLENKMRKEIRDD
jgi:hypothetical protein